VRPPHRSNFSRLAAVLFGAAALAWSPLAVGQQPPPADAPKDPPPADAPRDRGDVSSPRGSSGTIITPPAPAPTPGKAQPPRLVKYVDPVYPPEAQKKGLEAAVALQLDIDPTGKVTGATVIDPAGNGFDEAAIAAANQLQFEPARRANGQAAAARILYRFTFTLKPAAPPAGPDAPPAPAAPVERFNGVVLSDQGEVPLVGATITVATKDGPVVATASANGSFTFGDLPPGKYRVSIRAAGYDPLDVEEEIAEGEEIVVRYRLVATGDGLEVVIRGERPPREVTKRTLTKREIDRIPGTNGDALRSIQNLPGVARPPGIAGILLVRGSGPAETQTFIDGTPVPLIYHFGGLSSVVPTEVLSKIDFYPGNFGAEYGRVQGGIVDVGLRSPKDDGYHGLAQVDLIDARLLLEGPIPFIGDDGWTFMVAGRRSYIDAWLGPVLEAAGAGVTQAPVYYDYQFLVEHNDAETGRFRVGFFGSDDSLELLINEPAPGEPALSGNIGLATRFQRLQFLYENDIGDDDRIRAVLAPGQDDIEFSLGPIYFLLNVKSINGRFEHAHRFSKGVTFNSGVDFFAGNATVDLRIPEPSRPGEPPNQPFSTRPFRELSSEIAYMFPAIYEEVELTPIPRWRIVPGVRLDGYSFNGSFDLQPRASSRFDIFTGYPRTTVKGGAGVYSQPPQFQQVIEAAGGNPDLDSNRAIHYSLGLEQELTRQIEVSGESFFKQLDRQVRATAAPDGSGTSYDNGRIGYVVGGEFLLKYKPDERFFGWVAYTLSRSVRQDGPGEEEFLVNFDQTHILTMLGSYKLGHGWEFGARWRLVSGNLVDPFVCNPAEAGCDPNRVNGLLFGGTGTYIPIPLGNNTERLPPFHALDVRVDKRWQFAAWQLSAYLDIQNVYNNQNIEAISYNFNYTARQNVSGIPILPSIGLRADF
jgi:TonB family protein